MSNPNIFATVGTTLSIVEGVPSTLGDNETTGFPSLTYAKIGETGEFGEFGGTRQIIEWINTETGVVQKRGGSINYGEISFPIARDATDAGQTACLSALDGANAGKLHSFKMSLPTGEAIYFYGIVTGFTFNAGGANNMFGGSVTINLSSKPVPVAAP